MNKVKIIHETNTYYVSPVEDNPQQSFGDTSNLFMYRVENSEGEIVGCISFAWTRTARVVASDLVFRSDPEEELAYLALIPNLPYYPELTENLYPKCFRYTFNSMVEGLAVDSSEYNIMVKGGFIRAMQRLIFGGLPTDDQVRRQILTTLYNHWREDQDTYLPMPIVNIFVPVEMKTLIRNTRYLLDDVMLEANMLASSPPVIQSIGITNKGIKHVEDKSEFSINFPSEFVYQKFMGDHITATSSGDNSPVIINSQNISIAFDQMETEIKTSEVTNKQEILAIFGKLKEEVSQTNNPEKVIGILGEIKKKGAWLNDKILSHPLISQVIAQALAKGAGLI